jgi:hypothetical protein
VAGVVTQSGNTVLGVGLGVAGFLCMLGGAWLAMSRRQRRSAPSATADAPKARAPKQSVKTRLEERWQRRQDDR